MNSKGVVAVLDDDDRVLNSVRGLLESAGYDVAAFPSAESFLEGQCAGDCSCVVSDVAMGGMSGVDLRRILRQEHPDLEVILMTAHRDSLDLSEADVNDPLRFFEKPLDADRLLSAIATLARNI
jgi:FixJ family two-component response regulator